MFCLAKGYKTLKAREKIHSKDYVDRRIRKIAERLKEWHNYKTFECSDFFRGAELAELNRKVHSKAVSRLRLKLEWYEEKQNLNDMKKELKKKISLGSKGLFIVLMFLTLGACAPECSDPPTCKFKEGDEVQVKSSRWGKSGSIIEGWVTSECKCRYEVSQTTWVEGKVIREFSEAELEEKGGIFDGKKIIEIFRGEDDDD